MPAHETINYVEFRSNDLAATKAFFEAVFGWSFTDYGPDYTAFTDPVLEGGFFKADLCSTTANGGALVVLYSERLEETLAKVEAAGGTIVRPIISFPGGRRFQFTEPAGNELGVWSDRD